MRHRIRFKKNIFFHTQILTISQQKRRMIPMGNTLVKRGTMVDREAKAFAGGPGAREIMNYE